MSKQYLDPIPISSNDKAGYDQMSSSFAEELEKLGNVEVKEEITCSCECPPPPPPPQPPKKKPLKMTANLAHTLDDLRDKYIEVHYIYVYGTSGKLTDDELEQITETKSNYLVLEDNEIFELNYIDGTKNVYNNTVSDNQIGLKEIVVDTITGEWTSRYISLDVAGKQDLGYIELDKYLLNPDCGEITDAYDLTRLNTYLVNKVSVNTNIYYLALSDTNVLIYFCTNSFVHYNQITVTRSNGRFQLTNIEVGTTYHNELHNLDYLSSGHTGFAGIELGTTAYWNSKSSYRPVKGMIIVYTDYKEGKPAIKIGDGNAYLSNIPFVNEGIEEILETHIANNIIHITQEEREFWNNKLNFEAPTLGSDLLTFNRN